MGQKASANSPVWRSKRHRRTRAATSSGFKKAPSAEEHEEKEENGYPNHEAMYTWGKRRRRTRSATSSDFFQEEKMHNNHAEGANDGNPFAQAASSGATPAEPLLSHASPPSLSDTARAVFRST